MRRLFALLGVLLVSAIGCKPEDKAGSGQTVGETTREGTVQSDPKREEYARELQQKLDEADKDLEELRAKAARATGDAKVKLEQRLKELEPQREKARKDLEQFRSDSKRAWQEVKVGLDQSWSSLRDSLHRAREEFK